MNPQAAQEILDIIMLDDCVQRKQALDTWSRRWIATMHVEGRVDRMPPSTPVGQQVWGQLKGRLIREIFQGLLGDEVKSMLWGNLVENGEPNPLTIACQMHVILQEPRDVNAGTDAAKAMMEMAKGGGK